MKLPFPSKCVECPFADGEVDMCLHPKVLPEGFDIAIWAKPTKKCPLREDLVVEFEPDLTAKVCLSLTTT